MAVMTTGFTSELAAIGRAGAEARRRRRSAAEAATEERVSRTPHIAFAVGDELFALSTEVAREVIAPPPITPLPHVPAYVKGLVNLRGRLIPILDLRARLGLPEASTRETSIVIVERRDEFTGLVVDRLVDVFDLGPSEIQPVPALGAVPSARLLAGIAPREGGRQALLLDLDRLLGAGPAFLSE